MDTFSYHICIFVIVISCFHTLIIRILTHTLLSLGLAIAVRVIGSEALSEGEGVRARE